MESESKLGKNLIKYKYGCLIKHHKKKNLSWSKRILRKTYSSAKIEYLISMDFQRVNDFSQSIFMKTNAKR